MKLKLKFNCDKDFDEMKDHSTHRFCDSCEKEVYDLSQMNEQGVLDFYKSNPGICAKVNSDHLDLSLSRLSRFFMALFLVFGFSLFQIHGHSQDMSPNYQNGQRYEDYKLVIRGIVNDENGEAIPFANVVLSNIGEEELIFHEMTDFEGYFHIEIPNESKFNNENFQLSISSLGFDTLEKEYLVNKEHSIHEDLVLSSQTVIITMGKMMPRDTYNIVGIIALPTFGEMERSLKTASRPKSVDPNYQEIDHDMMDDMNLMDYD